MHANAVNQPHAYVVLWAQVPMGMANGCGCMLFGCVLSLRLSTLRCSADWGCSIRMNSYIACMFSAEPSGYSYMHTLFLSFVLFLVWRTISVVLYGILRPLLLPSLRCWQARVKMLR
jgi:hypothetical protein